MPIHPTHRRKAVERRRSRKRTLAKMLQRSREAERDHLWPA